MTTARSSPTRRDALGVAGMWLAATAVGVWAVESPRERRERTTFEGEPTRMTMNSAVGFDFLIGDWSVRHRRLKRRLAADTEWIEFVGRASARKILGGLANIDEMTIDLPSGPYVGATLRLFNPGTGLWSIYWMDSRNPALDPPVVGGFAGSRGLFYGDDTFEGRPIRIRFVWIVLSTSACTWEQAFSDDMGQSWETNWTMEFTRLGQR